MQDKEFVEARRAEAKPHKGIVYEADRGLFKATLYVGSEKHFAGRHDTVEQALAAIEDKRKEHPSRKRGRKVISPGRSSGVVRIVPATLKQPRHIFEHADVVAVALEKEQGAVPMLFEDFAIAVWRHLGKIGLTWGGITFDSMKRRLTADEPKAQRFGFSPLDPDGEPIAFGDDEKFVVLFEPSDATTADWQDAHERKVRLRRELIFEVASGCSASDERLPLAKFVEMCAARDADKLMVHPAIAVRRLARRAECPYRIDGDEVVFA